MSDDRPMVHFRLDRTLLKRIDHIAVDWGLDRARTVERLLDQAFAAGHGSPHDHSDPG